jgi:hypothetical protein
VWFHPLPRYVALYSEQLAKLNAEKVRSDLIALAAPAEPVLLCWERPPLREPSAADPKGNWCHRTMVTAWFKAELGEILTEVERSRHGQHP